MKNLVSKQDYFNFSGEDLDNLFRVENSDNPSNAVNIFISRVQHQLLEELKANYLVTDRMLRNKQEILRQAIIYQIEYFLLVGSIYIDNPEQKSLLSQSAINILRIGGIIKDKLVESD